MNTPHPLARRFAYASWANSEAYRSLSEQADALPDRAVAIFGHILGTERHWLARLGQAAVPADVALPIWPTLRLDEYRPFLVGLAASWPGLVSAFVADGLDRVVSYRNSQGDEFAGSVADILDHLLLHGAYHRGQVATLLGRSGLKSTNTDFIHWTRTIGPGPGR